MFIWVELEFRLDGEGEGGVEVPIFQKLFQKILVHIYIF